MSAGAAVGVPRGLPGHLPPGERLLWQGAPDARALARAALHVRGIAIYFAGLAILALGLRAPTGALATIIAGGAVIALLGGYAWAAARSTTYTLTDRRLVLRIGIALPTSINLPLERIAAVELSDGGDIALRLAHGLPLGWMVLWPHARPWRLSRPEPMLRCLPDAAAVAVRIGEACRAAGPVERAVERAPVVTSAPLAAVAA